MNYALFKDDLRLFGELLATRHNVPEYAIASILAYVDSTAIPAEAKQRSEQQYVLEFQRDGVAEVASRRGISPQAARKKLNKIINNQNRYPRLPAELRVA
jgi:hypothetical protein